MGGDFPGVPMSSPKPYSTVPIEECHDRLVPIQGQHLVLLDPHPYAKLGAPYGNYSPFFLRQIVLERLQQAAEALQQTHPGWTIALFDAYRPIPVQQFMVDYTFDSLAQEQSLDSQLLRRSPGSPVAQELWQRVYQFWALPSPDPKMPPPHSTGGAIDITLQNESGQAVDMGSPIDECSPRSYPNHFADATTPGEVQFHEHRQLLATLLTDQGFMQHPNEWWHFSWGDQLWAWQSQQPTAHFGAIA